MKKNYYTTHGIFRNGSKKQPPLYVSWRAMHWRCRDVTNKWYGGRGIRVCPSWKLFETFSAWAYRKGYQEGLTIDRINPNGNYSPRNCRWATTKQQSENTRSTILVSFSGATQSLRAWAKDSGIYYTTLRKRYMKGLRGSDLFSPANKLKSHPQKAGVICVDLV